MTEGDFERVEHDLAVNLPDVYRRSLCPFPIPEAAGNTDTDVWDDPHRLIALNQRLSAEVEDWPSWLFAIGEAEGDPCGYAIDTRSQDSPVWWLDHMRLGGGSGAIAPKFAAWFSRWVAEHSPHEPEGRPVLWFLLVWLALSVAALIAYWLRLI
jgi:hypothetical protein